MMIYHVLWKYFAVKRQRRQILTKRLLLERLRLSVRTRSQVSSNCLRKSADAPWMKVYSDGTDENFVALTSLTRGSFENLLRHFKKHFYIHRSFRGGRPSKFQHAHQGLGLILTFYCDTIGAKNLCQLFGLPPATLSRYLRSAERALRKSLREDPDAVVRWPNLAEQRDMAERVKAKNELVEGRWGFIDGKTFRVQSPSSTDLQNALYNGWLHTVFVTGTMCFAADGTIVWFRHNAPGSWNDGENSRGFQDKLAIDDINLPGHGVLSDSAFPVRGDMFNRIVTPLTDLERALPAARPAFDMLSNAITSMRQSAEWGMGAVEKVYRRLLERLPFDPNVRALRLKTIFRLYNYRVRTTGISQIRTYFYKVHY